MRFFPALLPFFFLRSSLPSLPSFFLRQPRIHAPHNSAPSTLFLLSTPLPACRSQFKGKCEIGKRKKRYERARAANAAQVSTVAVEEGDDNDKPKKTFLLSQKSPVAKLAGALGEELQLPPSGAEMHKGLSYAIARDICGRCGGHGNA